MIENISTWIIEYLEQKDIINDEKEIYIIGMGIMVNYFISIVTILALSLPFNCLFESLLFIFFFGYIREFVGGYHANSYLGCYIKFIILYLYSILSLHLEENLIICMTIISLTILFLIIPVEHPNNKLNYYERKKYRQIAIKRIFVSIISCIILRFFKLVFSKMIMIVLIITTGLALFQLLINKSEEEKHEKKII